MTRDLLYLNEHTSCRHYVSDYRCRFRFFEFQPGDKRMFEGEPFNFMEFILEGEAVITCNEFENRTFTTGQMILIPKGAIFKISATTKCRIMRLAFDAFDNVCDKFSLRSYWPICANMTYDFQPMEIRSQLRIFLDSMDYYLHQGINCEHYHKLKLQEMFLILRWFYQKEELARFFYPIIGKSIDFKALILENYLKVSSVPELVELSHMGRSHFDSVFKDEFGMPARQWMLKQTAYHVKYYLSEPGATISDIMIRFNFNSPTHFTRFCKSQFGCTPTELIAKLKEQ